jgi:hypothetical protein
MEGFNKMLLPFTSEGRVPQFSQFFGPSPQRLEGLDAFFDSSSSLDHLIHGVSYLVMIGAC